MNLQNLFLNDCNNVASFLVVTKKWIHAIIVTIRICKMLSVNQNACQFLIINIEFVTATTQISIIISLSRQHPKDFGC